jgi:hypothetical protein
MPRPHLDSSNHIEELSDPRENREESIPVVVPVIISIVVVPMMVPGPSIFVRVTIMAVAVSVVIIRSVLLVSGVNVNAESIVCFGLGRC